MDDPWSRKLFIALCRRYEVQTYRYRDQHHSSIMAKVSKRFVDETLWPEFEQLSVVLRTYPSEFTDRIVKQAIHQDTSEAAKVAATAQLPSGGD